MKSKSVKLLLALILTFVVYLVAYSLTGCTVIEEAEPECDMVEAFFNGEDLSLIIHSESDTVRVCRDFFTGERCFTFTSHYFSCINLSANQGETITFDDGIDFCSIKVK